MRFAVLCATALCGAILGSAPAHAAERGNKNPVIHAPNKSDPIDNPNRPNANPNGAPKINDGVAGGNSTNSGQTQRTLPGSSTTGGSNTNPSTTSNNDLPTAPDGTLGGKNNASVGGQQGTKVTPGDFSRDKQLNDLTDTSVGKVKGDSGNGTATGPLSDNPANPLTSATATGAVPRAGSGTPSKRGQQSDDGGSATDVTTVPAGGAPVPIPYPNVGGSDTKTVKIITPKDTGGGTSNGDNAGTVTGVTSGQNMDSTKYATGRTSVRVEGAPAARIVPSKAGAGTQTPDPSNDTGDGKGVPASVQQLGGTGKSPSVSEAERKRQVTQPNESGTTSPDKMHMDNAAQQNIQARQSNLINPQRDDGSTSGLGVGVAPPSQGTGSNPTNGKAGGGQGSGPPRGGSTPDNPAACPAGGC